MGKQMRTLINHCTVHAQHVEGGWPWRTSAQATGSLVTHGLPPTHPPTPQKIERKKKKEEEKLVSISSVHSLNTFQGQTTYSSKHNARSLVKIAVVVLRNDLCLAVSYIFVCSGRPPPPPPSYYKWLPSIFRYNQKLPQHIWQIMYAYVCGFAWSDMVHGCITYGVHRTCAETAAVSCGTSHASAVSTPLWRIFKNAPRKASHSCGITCELSESARKRRIALYKSNHHKIYNCWQQVCLQLCAGCCETACSVVLALQLDLQSTPNQTGILKRKLF